MRSDNADVSVSGRVASSAERSDKAVGSVSGGVAGSVVGSEKADVSVRGGDAGSGAEVSGSAVKAANGLISGKSCCSTVGSVRKEVVSSVTGSEGKRSVNKEGDMNWVEISPGKGSRTPTKQLEFGNVLILSKS